MKYQNIATAAISAVLGLMSLALSAKESYIGTDSTIVVRDYIANMEYVNGVLERVNFEGGYIDMTGESPRYMYYVTDHLGNVRTVVDEDGHVCQVNHYYPYGDRIDDSRDISAEGSDNMRLFGGKEYSEDTGLHDFEARYDNTLFGRFTTLDPMAEKYYSVSPYAYCAGNPVRFVDPDGRHPIYDEFGSLLGTDDEGLQGDPIIMNSQYFIQGMSYSDASAYNLGIGGLSDQSAYDKFHDSYSGLSSRPDWDGYLTLREVNDWFHSGSGLPLYASLDRLDFYLLFPWGEKSIGKNKVINLFVNSNNAVDALVYGQLTLKRYPDQSIRAYSDIYDFDMKPWANPRNWGRNVETIIGRLVAGEGKGFEINLYGSKKIEYYLSK